MIGRAPEAWITFSRSALGAQTSNQIFGGLAALATALGRPNARKKLAHLPALQGPEPALDKAAFFDAV